MWVLDCYTPQTVSRGAVVADEVGNDVNSRRPELLIRGLLLCGAGCWLVSWLIQNPSLGELIARFKLAGAKILPFLFCWLLVLALLVDGAIHLIRSLGRRRAKRLGRRASGAVLLLWTLVASSLVGGAITKDILDYRANQRINAAPVLSGATVERLKFRPRRRGTALYLHVKLEHVDSDHAFVRRRVNSKVRRLVNVGDWVSVVYARGEPLNWRFRDFESAERGLGLVCLMTPFAIGCVYGLFVGFRRTLGRGAAFEKQVDAATES